MIEETSSYQLATPQAAQATNIPLTIGISSSIAVSIAAFLFKWLFEQTVASYRDKFASLDKRLEKLDTDVTESISKSEQFRSELVAKHEQLRSELGSFKCDIAQEYVTREDWIRSNVGLENKLERVAVRLDDKLDRIFEKLSGVSK